MNKQSGSITFPSCTWKTKTLNIFHLLSICKSSFADLIRDKTIIVWMKFRGKIKYSLVGEAYQ